VVFSPVVVYVSPGFSTDAQTLFGQIKSLSRLKVFTRGDFEVQFLEVKKMKSSSRFAKNRSLTNHLRGTIVILEFFIEKRDDEHSKCHGVDDDSWIVEPKFAHQM